MELHTYALSSHRAAIIKPHVGILKNRMCMGRLGHCWKEEADIMQFMSHYKDLPCIVNTKLFMCP